MCSHTVSCLLIHNFFSVRRTKSCIHVPQAWLNCNWTSTSPSPKHMSKTTTQAYIKYISLKSELTSSHHHPIQSSTFKTASLLTNLYERLAIGCLIMIERLKKKYVQAFFFNLKTYNDNEHWVQHYYYYFLCLQCSILRHCGRQPPPVEPELRDNPFSLSSGQGRARLLGIAGPNGGDGSDFPSPATPQSHVLEQLRRPTQPRTQGKRDGSTST